MQTDPAKTLTKELQRLGIKNVYVSTMWQGHSCPEHVCITVTTQELDLLRDNEELLILHEWSKSSRDEQSVGVYVTTPGQRSLRFWDAFKGSPLSSLTR